ncbi:MAG: hypothetical protein ACTSUE_08650 [Promethearchaeota archaeon]
MTRDGVVERRKALAITWFLIFLVPVIVMPIFQTQGKDVPDVPKLVMANLYTWYGTPTGPAGEYGYQDFIREGTPMDWNNSSSTMNNVLIDNSSVNTFNISGDAIAGSNDEIVLSINADAFGLPIANGRYVRIYFTFNISTNNTDANCTFHIKKDGVDFQTNLSLETSFQVTRKLFPFDFTNTTHAGSDELSIQFTANTTGSYSFAVDSMRIGRWKHYNEDTLEYYNTDEGEWFNHPPFTKATDKNVFFPGNISDALGSIPAYGNYSHEWTEMIGPNLDQPRLPDYYLGIYDSLDPVVIEAQLRLMHWAGVDVVMLMHPWSFDVAETIMNIAWDVKERVTALGNGSTFDIQFAYYNGWDTMQDLLPKIKNYEHYDELYLKVNDGPVFYVGPTGLLAEPYANFNFELNAIRSAHPDVFMVGDGYLPPKEEMLYLLDGFYFYDTSGLMRQGYGLPGITVYQADGTPSTGYGELDMIFGATATMVHGHGLIYASTVIPGTDNTCVHDFEGTPLYDGRPGTIVERTGGLTFNYTWQTSIDAGADWITITSWNELHEGTEIEPTFENGTYYIESCRNWSNTFKI